MCPGSCSGPGQLGLSFLPAGSSADPHHLLPAACDTHMFVQAVVVGQAGSGLAISLLAAGTSWLNPPDASRLPEPRDLRGPALAYFTGAAALMLATLGAYLTLPSMAFVQHHLLQTCARLLPVCTHARNTHLLCCLALCWHASQALQASSWPQGAVLTLPDWHLCSIACMPLRCPAPASSRGCGSGGSLRQLCNAAMCCSVTCNVP